MCEGRRGSSAVGVSLTSCSPTPRPTDCRCCLTSYVPQVSPSLVKGRQVVCFTYLFGLTDNTSVVQDQASDKKKKKEARGKIGGRAGGWRWPTLGGLVLGCVCDGGRREGWGLVGPTTITDRWGEPSASPALAPVHNSPVMGRKYDSGELFLRFTQIVSIIACPRKAAR